MINNPSGAAMLGLLTLLSVACVSRPPTIAHVHIGHAITGVHVTPGNEGYFVVAEKRAKETLDLAQRASASRSLGEIKSDVGLAVVASNDEDTFGVKHALIMAANHITFAATSPDASINVQNSAPLFAAHITRVIERCDLIELLGKDVQASTTADQAVPLVAEIVRLADANLHGDAANGNGAVGTVPSDYGLAQLRTELEAMIAREKPPYVTVDRWYLFNLVRLPNGNWVFDKFGRGGNIEGYK